MRMLGLVVVLVVATVIAIVRKVKRRPAWVPTIVAAYCLLWVIVRLVSYISLFEAVANVSPDDKQAVLSAGLDEAAARDPWFLLLFDLPFAAVIAWAATRRRTAGRSLPPPPPPPDLGR